MSKTLKLAFVGCGAISRFHLDGIQESAPSVQVTAAIDPDRGRAEAIAAETGAQVFSSLEEGLDRGDFDAVDLMLPHDLHESATLQALEAGKHVLLEKPMAPGLDRKPLEAGPEQSLGELRTALAIYRSAVSGKWESVWS